MKIINKTPHPVNIVNDKNEVVRTFSKADQLIRLKMDIQRRGSLTGVPISMTVFGDPEGLPEEREYIFYIVSQLVKNALPERCDLLVPAEVVRDDKGNIIGCKSLGR